MGEVVRLSQGADLAALLDAAAAEDSGIAYRYRRYADTVSNLEISGNYFSTVGYHGYQT